VWILEDPPRTVWAEREGVGRLEPLDLCDSCTLGALEWALGDRLEEVGEEVGEMCGPVPGWALMALRVSLEDREGKQVGFPWAPGAGEDGPAVGLRVKILCLEPDLRMTEDPPSKKEPPRPLDPNGPGVELTPAESRAVIRELCRIRWADDGYPMRMTGFAPEMVWESLGEKGWIWQQVGADRVFLLGCTLKELLGAAGIYKQG